MSSNCDNKSSMRKVRFQQEGKIQSFSSSLLDEIYRSIDDSDKKQENLSSVKKNQSNNGGFSTKSRVKKEEDEAFSFRKACLVEQWTDNKVSEKIAACRGYHSPGNDTLFFNSSTSGSDLSSGEFSSENDFFPGGKNMGSSCTAHSLPKPKPIRTSVSQKLPVTEINRDALFYKTQSHVDSNEDDTDNTIKSKLRALNIYKNLKKMKQPISPGVRLTTFLNSIFASANSKKTKESNLNKSFDQMGSDKTTPKPKCSSASSFSRLSKISSTREKQGANGCKKTETFYPDSKFITPKGVDHKNLSQIPTPICSKPLNQSTLMRNEELSFRLMGKNQSQQRSNVFVNRDFRGNYEDGKGGDDDDEDAMSDSSSDLFELDNLESIGESYKHCDELPVYETTRMLANRVIC